MSVAPARVAVAQQVVALISPGVSLTYDRGFWFAWAGHGGAAVRKRWVAQSPESDFPKWYHHIPAGGTWCVAVSELMRWCRGRPVRPLRVWRNWLSPAVSLGDARAVQLLAAACWPEAVPCVICGVAITPLERFDWYGFGGRHSGPGHPHGALYLCDQLRAVVGADAAARDARRDAKNERRRRALRRQAREG